MKKILIIDDELTTIGLLKHGLNVSGYDVTTASDGMEGAVIVKDLKPDLVICDIMMPNLDGYSFVGECNKDPELKEIPIFVLTSHEDIKEKFNEGDIAGYFLKPVDLRAILSKVIETIGDS